MIFNHYTCIVCGVKKGRGFNHDKCSEQAKAITRKPSKARNVIRQSDIDYIVKSTS